MKKYIKRLFQNDRKSTNDTTFAEFFLHASPDEKERVFKRAAKRANKDQRELLKI